MKKHERIREKVTILPTSMYLSKMHDAGWTLIALEWEREVETSSAPEPPEEVPGSEEIPFGLRIAADCHHLEDDPLETQTLKFLAELIVQDVSFIEHGRRAERPRLPHARRSSVERCGSLSPDSPPD